MTDETVQFTRMKEMLFTNSVTRVICIQRMKRQHDEEILTINPLTCIISHTL